MSDVQAPKRTFAEICAVLNNVDELLESDIDVADIVGELRGKVDGIDRIINFFTFIAEEKQEEAARAMELSAKASRKVASIEAYVLMVMQKNELEAVPGELVMVKRQKASSAPVETVREATAADFIHMPNFVRIVPPVPQGYAWDKKALYKALSGKDGAPHDAAPSQLAQSVAKLGPRKESLKWGNRIPEVK